MAVVTGNWYLIEFQPFSDASWLSLSAYPSLPPSVLEAIVKADEVLLYCLDDTSLITFIGENTGQFTVASGVILSDSTMTKLDVTLDNGTTWACVIDSLGEWKFYDSVAGVQSLASPAALKAFLP